MLKISKNLKIWRFEYFKYCAVENIKNFEIIDLKNFEKLKSRIFCKFEVLQISKNIKIWRQFEENSKFDEQNLKY